MEGNSARCEPSNDRCSARGSRRSTHFDPDISLTDQAARWTAATRGPAFFAYSKNCRSDLSAGIILEVRATPAHRSDEVNSTRAMMDRFKQRLHLAPCRLVGDTANDTAPMLDWMVKDKAIEPHVPVGDKTARQDDSLSVGDFTWHEGRNECRCPQGKPLKSEWRQFKNRASQLDCAEAKA